MTAHELMKALAEHAKTLGWDIEEWNFHDETDGCWAYDLWLRPLDQPATEEPA